MANWVRLWDDMPNDPKWRTIARKSGQRVGDVMAVFNFMLVNAGGNVEARGSLLNFDAEDVATALDLDEADVLSIMDAMQGKVLGGQQLTGWNKRQPKREDNSRDRVSAYRDRQRNETKRTVTHCNAPETETETETETEVVSNETTNAREALDLEFSEFWAIWPHKVGKPAAIAKFRTARKSESVETILDGVRRYIRDKPPDRPWLNPATFLHQRRWEDDPAPVCGTGPPKQRHGGKSIGQVVAEMLAESEDGENSGDQSNRDNLVRLPVR